MTNTTNNQQKNLEEGGIDLRQIGKRIRKFWYLFILLPMLMSALAWAYLQYQVPVYEVKSAILIKDEKNKQGISATDLISKELGLSGSKKMLVDESKIMTSYTVIEKVVKDLKLDRTVLVTGTVIDKEVYGEKAPIKIDSFVLRDTITDFKAALEVLDDNTFELTTADKQKQTGTFGTTFTNKYGDFLINKGYKTADKKFKIACTGTEKTASDIIKTISIDIPKKESNILEPTIKTTMPEKAKAILQRMVEVYNDNNIGDKKEVSENTVKFIKQRLDTLTTELAGVEQNTQAYKAREGITNDGMSDINYFFNKLGETDSELVKLEVQNSVLTSIEALLTKIDPNFDLLPTNLELKSATLQTQIADYNKQVLERNRLAKVAGDYNPNLKNLTLEINNNKRAIIENIRRVKNENAIVLAQTRAKNDKFAGKLGEAPRNEREMTDRKRQQSIKEGLYLFLLQKKEETAISMVGAIADARIIDRPIVGATPVSIKKSIVYLAALMAGLFLSFLFVILQGLVVDTVQSEADIKSKTPIPVLAKIPFNKTNNNWVVKTGSQTMITEMFRSLRSNLQFYLPQTPQNQGFTEGPSEINPREIGRENRKGKALLITSATSGEGKNFITLNLAMSLAMANKKTVIVSLDLRSTKLSLNFPLLSTAAGITQYVTTDLYPHEIVQPSGKHDNLYFVNSGMIPQNPAELMMDAKMAILFSYLKEKFDYIVINTPPIGLVSDAVSLKPYVDLTLYVVRFGFTKRTDLDILQSFFEGQKLPNPTIVFNAVKGIDKMENTYYNKMDKNTPKEKSSVFSTAWFKTRFS
jgi:tyrosine-protein kinase Etk/Wzc